MGNGDDPVAENLEHKCVASSIHQTVSEERSSARPTAGFFKSAQWSVDGTTVVTNSEDNKIRCYIL